MIQASIIDNDPLRQPLEASYTHVTVYTADKDKWKPQILRCFERNSAITIGIYQSGYCIPDEAETEWPRRTVPRPRGIINYWLARGTQQGALWWPDYTHRRTAQLLGEQRGKRVASFDREQGGLIDVGFQDNVELRILGHWSHYFEAMRWHTNMPIVANVAGLMSDASSADLDGFVASVGYDGGWAAEQPFRPRFDSDTFNQSVRDKPFVVEKELSNWSYLLSNGVNAYWQHGWYKQQYGKIMERGGTREEYTAAYLGELRFLAGMAMLGATKCGAEWRYPQVVVPSFYGDQPWARWDTLLGAPTGAVKFTQDRAVRTFERGAVVFDVNTGAVEVQGVPR